MSDRLQTPAAAAARLDDLLSYRLAVAGRLLRGWVDSRLAAEGVSAQGVGVLLRLAEEDGLTQVELARRNRVEAPTICRMVDRLEHGGLVERRPHPADRRASRVLLTDEGRRVAERAAAVAAELEERAFGGLLPHERGLVAALVDAVIERAGSG